VKCVWGNSDSPTPFRVCFNKINLNKDDGTIE
jgi:hypothetical protein